MIEVREIQSSLEQEIVFEIRKSVFIDEQNVPSEEEFDEFEKKSTHFLAFFNGIPAGTARMRTTLSGIKLERFAVLKEYRRIKVGSNLVKKLLTNCKKEIESKVYLYAQLTAQKFYEKFDFEIEGEIFLDAGIEHIEMEYREKKETK